MTAYEVLIERSVVRKINWPHERAVELPSSPSACCRPAGTGQYRTSTRQAWVDYLCRTSLYGWEVTSRAGQAIA